jgi:predicted transcriptional regulator YdeE
LNTESIVKPEISLIGVAVRTTNAEEAGPSGRLSALWNTYFASGIAEQIEASNAHLIYALYTDYESDAGGAYTVLIGHERSDAAAVLVPTGMEQAKIPESKFIVFKTRKGPVYEVVLEAWVKIWAYFEHSSIERAYTGDYELYDGRNFNPADAEVDIYIAIK